LQCWGGTGPADRIDCRRGQVRGGTHQPLDEITWKGKLKIMKRIYRAVVPNAVRKIIRNDQARSSKQTIIENQLQAAFDLYKSKGLMFIHIPKAAGVSVFQALYGRDSWGHAPLSAFVDFIGREEIYSIPRACIVRDPYLRLHSGYRYLREGGRGKGLDAQRQEMLRPYDTFEKFVKEYLASGDALQIIHFKPQNYWVTDVSGKLGVDYVGRFERIDDSLNEMINLFGINASPLPKLNEGKNQLRDEVEERMIIELFDYEMMSIVNNVYRNDFRLFDYSIFGKE